MSRKSRAKAPSPFRYFHSSPEVIRLVVTLYVRFPLSLRNVEDLLSERGIEVCHETVRHWWNRFGPIFAAILSLLARGDPAGGDAVRQVSVVLAQHRGRHALDAAERIGQLIADALSESRSLNHHTKCDREALIHDRQAANPHL